jgi:putative redox protein
MAVAITGEYLGDQRVAMTHGPSGARLVTDAPLDNGGRGESFSPTDLAATALAACMMTIMALVAERDGIPLRGATVRVEKHMAANPRRIARLPVTFRMPPGLSAADRTKLENAARGCPVHRSLHPEVEVTVTFEYPE